MHNKRVLKDDFSSVFRACTGSNLISQVNEVLLEVIRVCVLLREGETKTAHLCLSALPAVVNLLVPNEICRVEQAARGLTIPT